MGSGVISLITALQGNGSAAPVERQRLLDWIKKARSNDAPPTGNTL